MLVFRKIHSLFISFDKTMNEATNETANLLFVGTFTA